MRSSKDGFEERGGVLVRQYPEAARKERRGVDKRGIVEEKEKGAQVMYCKEKCI